MSKPMGAQVGRVRCPKAQGGAHCMACEEERVTHQAQPECTDLASTVEAQLSKTSELTGRRRRLGHHRITKKIHSTACV